jgi:hypothetical protein
MPNVGRLLQAAWAVTLALGTVSAAQAAATVYATTQTIATPGVTALNTPFTIDTAGLYVASLFDLDIGVPFSFIEFGVSAAGGGTLGSVISGSGSTNFTAIPGNYFANIVAVPGILPGPSGFVASTFSANVTLVPEPETWAMMLIGVGLVGWQLRRKLRLSAASRLL